MYISGYLLQIYLDNEYIIKIKTLRGHKLEFYDNCVLKIKF